MSQLAVGFKSGMSSGREQRTDGLWKHLGQIDGGHLRAVNANPVLTGAGVEIGHYSGSAAGQTQGYIQSIDRDAGVLRDLLFSARNLNLYSNTGSVNLSGPVRVAGGFDSVASLPGTGFSTPGDVSVNRGNNTGAYYFCDASHFLYWDGAQFQLSGGKLLLNTPGSIRTADIVANAVSQPIGSQIIASSFSTTTVGAWIATPASVQATTTGGLLRIDMSLPLFHSVTGTGFYCGYMMDGAIQAALAYYNAPGVNYTVNFGMTWYAQPAAGIHTFTIAIYNGNAGTLGLNAAAYSTIFVTEQKR